VTEVQLVSKVLKVMLDHKENKGIKEIKASRVHKV
jgi:hypothetical protein